MIKQLFISQGKNGGTNGETKERDKWRDKRRDKRRYAREQFRLAAEGGEREAFAELRKARKGGGGPPFTVHHLTLIGAHHGELARWPTIPMVVVE